MQQKIGFIGGGNMASSLIGGLLEDDANINAESICVFEPNPEKAERLSAEFGVKLASDNTELVGQSDVVVVAVKPQVLESVLTPLRQSFQQSMPLLISVVAGITAESMVAWLECKAAVVRVMPNTPALVGVGASGMYANEHVSSAQRLVAEQLMNAVGISAWVQHDADIDSVTALSGSGPAYFMLFIQGLVDAAVGAGLDEETALRLATQTCAGAAKLVASSDTPIQTLIDNVTSPGGTTEQALISLNQAGLRDIAANAFDAAKRRSEELAAELG